MRFSNELQVGEQYGKSLAASENAQKLRATVRMHQQLQPREREEQHDNTISEQRREQVKTLRDVVIPAEKYGEAHAEYATRRPTVPEKMKANLLQAPNRRGLQTSTCGADTDQVTVFSTLYPYLEGCMFETTTTEGDSGYIADYGWIVALDDDEDPTDIKVST